MKNPLMPSDSMLVCLLHKFYIYIQVKNTSDSFMLGRTISVRRSDKIMQLIAFIIRLIQQFKSNNSRFGSLDVTIIELPINSTLITKNVRRQF